MVQVGGTPGCQPPGAAVVQCPWPLQAGDREGLLASPVALEDTLSLWNLISLLTIICAY